VEQNALLNTIRIPKNIMYLSDKLPRPSYESMHDDGNFRNTTNDEGYTLPAIPAQKKPKQKPSKNMYIMLLLTNSVEIYSSSPPEDDSKLHKKRKPRKVTKASIKSNNDASPGKDLTDEQIESKNNSQSVKLPETSIDKSPERNEQQYEPIRIKKDSRKLASIVEETKPAQESPVRPKDYKMPEVSDSYIHQLVSKKNPILKQPNINMQRIANIYSGNYADHVISMHKR
jgi:hypothetical protein